MSIKNLTSDNTKSDQNLQVNSLDSNTMTVTNNITASSIECDVAVIETTVVSNGSVESVGPVFTDDRLFARVSLNLQLSTVTQDYGVSSIATIDQSMAKITFTNVPNIGALGVLIVRVNWAPILASTSVVFAKINAMDTTATRLLDSKINQVQNGFAEIAIHNQDTNIWNIGTFQFFFLCIQGFT